MGAFDTVDADAGGASLPRTGDAVLATAAAAGIVVPPPCLPGVLANLAVLAGHAATLRAGAANGPP